MNTKDFDDAMNVALMMAQEEIGHDAQIVFIGGDEPWAISATCVGGRKIVGKGINPIAAIYNSCSCFAGSEHLETCLKRRNK